MSFDVNYRGAAALSDVLENGSKAVEEIYPRVLSGVEGFDLRLQCLAKRLQRSEQSLTRRVLALRHRVDNMNRTEPDARLFFLHVRGLTRGVRSPCQDDIISLNDAPATSAAHPLRVAPGVPSPTGRSGVR